jgi:predicted DNA-binding transcriptional regulator AlpA
MQKLMNSTAAPVQSFGGARHSYSVPQVLAITGWSKSTLYVKIAAGIFPAPYKPDPEGRRVIFDGPEVDEHQRCCIARRPARRAEHSDVAS